MNALYLTLFVSLSLAAGAILLFAAGWQRRDQDHADRLSLLPLEDDPPKDVALDTSAAVPLPASDARTRS